MKLIIIALFLLGMQGCVLSEFQGNVYNANKDILWTETFTGEDRCNKITAKKATSFQGGGAVEGEGVWSWDCFQQ
jgi:hypothetical protein